MTTETDPQPDAAAEPKVCDNCGMINAGDVNRCTSCGKTRFAPPWVHHLRRITRNLLVQVSAAHPLSSSTTDHITLYKWWPGGKAKFNINDQSQWEAIKLAIDAYLASAVGWSSPGEVEEVRQTRAVKEQVAAAELQSLAKTDPALVIEILKNLSLDLLSHISEEEIPEIGAMIAGITEILVKLEQSHRRVIQQLIAKLPAHGERSVRDLSDLTNELTIAQITAVAAEVQRRVSFLRMFRERVLDEQTYEINGDKSIHRLLEQAMWIVDEHYWLMHSNKQLRTIVTQELEKRDKKSKLKRPDFVCGTVDRKLIIIEIKRPSHTLTVADLNQLEKYVVLCEEYHTEHSSIDAILVGSKKADELTGTLKVRGGPLKVRTYTDLISDTERRYSNYLKVLDTDNLGDE
jgi:hypothetical protein